MLLLSELTGRALLRNLRLLQGLRPSAGSRRLRLGVCGPQCAAIAARLRLLEPSLDVLAHGEGASGGAALDLAPLAGARLDSLLLAQPYHALRSRGELAGLQAALHPEDGTLGLLWARAMPSEGWGAAYTRGVASAGSGSGSGGSSALPLLMGSEASPMAWVDELGLGGFGFEAPKHRKFIEVIEGACALAGRAAAAASALKSPLQYPLHPPHPPTALHPPQHTSAPAGPPQQHFEAMPLLHDARLPLGAASAAQRAGEAAAAAAPPGSFTIHQHAFHCVQSAGVLAAQKRKQAEQAAGAAGSGAASAAQPGAR